MVGRNGIGHFFKRVVLPVFGCATIMPRCPLPMGEKRSMILVLIVLSFSVILNFSSGKRCEVLESHSVTHIIRLSSVDLNNLEQREILFTFAGRTDISLDGIAAFQSPVLDLALCEVDIVW